MCLNNKNISSDQIIPNLTEYLTDGLTTENRFSKLMDEIDTNFELDIKLTFHPKFMDPGVIYSIT
jgi:hypothetical protein